MSTLILCVIFLCVVITGAFLSNVYLVVTMQRDAAAWYVFLFFLFLSMFSICLFRDLMMEMSAINEPIEFAEGPLSSDNGSRQSFLESFEGYFLISACCIQMINLYIP